MVSFHVGQKVVCIDAHNTTWEKRKFLGLISYRKWWSELVEGEIYTVKEVFYGHDPVTGREGVALTVAEAKDWPGTGFRATRFRPVIERKTDISIFTSMLNKPTVKVPA